MTPKKQTTVKILYRNYKPLHKIYESLVNSPPKNTTYIVPQPKVSLNRFMFIYRKYKQNAFIKRAIAIVNRFVFSNNGSDSDVDMYQYVNMISNNPNSSQIPYIVDVERASSLTGFIRGSGGANKAISFLTDDNCKAIVCMSKAAEGSLKKLVGSKWPFIKSKTQIIYPTIPLPKTSRPNRTIIKNKEKLNLLFVGNQSGRKGLTDLLEAIKILNEKHQDKIELYIISNDAQKLADSYNLPNIYLFKPQYTKQEMLEKFFTPADLFMFPTRGDTYGLAVVDALASGTPVVATKQFALPELISHEQDGILIDVKEPALDKYLYLPKYVVEKINSQETKFPDITKQLVGVVERFVQDKSELKSWSKNARKKFSGSNLLSIAERNRRYKKIYDKVSK